MKGQKKGQKRFVYGFSRQYRALKVIALQGISRVARDGVEPSTFRVSVGRSYQLSYLAWCNELGEQFVAKARSELRA